MFKKKIKVVETAEGEGLEPKKLPIAEKVFEDINVISIRHKGRYTEIGDFVAILMKTAGIKGQGTPFCIFHDDREKEIRDIEICMPVSRKISKPDIEYKTIKGGKFLVTMQNGAYSELGRGFKELEEYAKENGVKIGKSTREYYIKGPALFVKKYPNRFVTALCYEIED